MPHLPPAGPRHGLSRLVLQAAAILLAGWFALSPALHGDWLWDDNSEITTNVELRDPAGWWKTWVAPATQDYFPLKTGVQWLQWRLWHDHSTLGYHATNLALHLASALLLWRLLHKLGLRFAWLGGLLFVVHPLTVESVAWIAELKNTLSLPLLLLALCAWVDFDDRRRPAGYALALALFLAALFAKSSVVMTPFALLLYAWWKRRRIDRTDLTATAPFFAASLLLGLVTIWFQHHRAIDTWEIPLGGAAARLGSSGLALAFYFFKTVWPANLAPVYPPWPAGLPTVVRILPWLVAIAAAFWFWRRRGTWGRHALLGLGWFVLCLLPVLGFVRMSYLHLAPVADHFAYLPLLGIVGLAVAAVEGMHPGAARRVVLGGVVLVATIFAGLSRHYAEIFAGPEKFWTHALAANPGTWLAPNNLGVLRLRDKKWSDAAGLLETAVRLAPNEPTAQLNLANALAHLGRIDDAILHGREAVRLEPDAPEARFNLANTYDQAGRLPEAIASYEEALRLSPGSPDIQFNLANTLLRAGRLPEAIARYSAAVAINPGLPGAQLNFGNALAASDRLADALPHFEQAVRLAPESAEARYALADALAQTGRPADSLPHYAEAVRLAPDNADVQASFGDALLRLGRAAEAATHYEAALRLQPDNPAARAGLNLIRRGSVPRN